MNALGFEQIVFAATGIVVALLLAIIGLVTASKTVDRLTVELDEWDEIRKGNAAVAIYFAGVLVSVGLMITPSIVGLAAHVSKISSETPLLTFIDPIERLVAVFIMAIIVQYIGIRTFTRMTRAIDEWAELRRGNLAVGIAMAATLVVLGLISVQVIDGLVRLMTA